MKVYSILSIFIAVFVLCIIQVTAWPYQLNLTNGNLTDMNSSNNATTNLTIFIVNNSFVNQTNLTNITVVNCTNCSYNITNNTYYQINGTNTSFYNRSENEAKFLTISDFNSYKVALTYPYPSRAEFDALVLKVNQTATIETSHGSLWGVSIVAILIALVAVFIAFKGGGSNE